MAKIKLLFHRVRQYNVGTGMKPEYVHKEQPVVIECSIPRMYERDPSQPVHLSDNGVNCQACNEQADVWTDDVSLWEGHKARCNVAYVP